MLNKYAFCYTLYMKKLLFFILLSVLFSACAKTRTIVTLPDGFSVEVRLALTPEEQQNGLMFVKHLPENQGMLFVFDQNQQHIFWMKNTLIDLDIVFLDDAQQVTSVSAQVPRSYTYTPDNQVALAPGYGQYVLELASKTAAKHGVKEGAKISFEL